LFFSKIIIFIKTQYYRYVNKIEENKMHKKTIIMIFLAALLTFTVVPVLAIKPAGPAAKNGLEKGPNDHLYLFEKNSSTWEIVENPKWAKMNINNKHDKFVFNAHGVTPEENYTLICYLDPWPGEGSIWLGNATATEEGNVHITGTINVDDLHAAALEKFESDPDPILEEGSKIWLVPTDDFEETEQKMVDWNPEEILFEFDLLRTEPTES
jgi:hypothetical protein